MNRLTAGLTQCLSQRGRKLRIDQKEQNLFRRDNRVVRLPGRKSQNRVDISILEIRIFLKDCLSRLASRHQGKNVRDRNAQAAHAGAAMHTIGVDRYSFQKVWQRQYHSSIVAPSWTFVSYERVSNHEAIGSGSG